MFPKLELTEQVFYEIMFKKIKQPRTFKYFHQNTTYQQTNAILCANMEVKYILPCILYKGYAINYKNDMPKPPNLHTINKQIPIILLK